MKLFTIPNLLTLGNLFCGCLAVVTLFTFQNQLAIEQPQHLSPNIYIAIVLILLLLSLLFDLLDGMIARAMKINSEIGVQLDSLADMVSFGLVPGLMMLILLDQFFPINNSGQLKVVFDIPWLPFLGLLITLFSALRLAKFNVDTEQTTYFKGLATPANTILIFSLFWIKLKNGFIISQEYDLYFLIGITLVSCYLLIANIPLFSFKFKGFAWKDNDYKYVFLGISLILLILFQMNSVPFIILLYIITSVIFRKKIIHA